MCAQSEVLPPGAARARPQRARSAVNLSMESGLGSMAITEESGEDAAAVDQADMEEEVVGEPLFIPCRVQMKRGSFAACL